MDPVEHSRVFAAAQMPGSTLVLLGGSHARGTATVSSDLDLVAIDPTAEWAYRQTSVTTAGVKVEQFVYRDLGVLGEWFDRQLNDRYATLFSLCAESVVIIDRSGIAGTVQADAAARLSAGPGPLPADRHDAIRYHLTDLVDDVIDITTDELPMIAAIAWRQAAEAICHSHNWWVGQGKWLHRYIHTLDPKGASRLNAALISAVNGVRGPLVVELNRILERLGGRLDTTTKLVAARPRHVAAAAVEDQSAETRR